MRVIDWLLDRVKSIPRRQWVQVMGGGLAGSYRQEIYRSAEARAAADVIARHAAKFRARHIGIGDEKNDELTEILTLRPNPNMNAYDFQYKLVMQTLMKNNGFALIAWKGMKVKGLIPIDYENCEAISDGDDLFLDFTLTNGKRLVADYGDVIHLRRFFGMSRVMGDGNEPLKDAVELSETLNAGLKSAVKNGSTIRGLLKFQKKAINREELVKRRNEFVADYMDQGNESGVAGLDADMEYVPLDTSKLYRVDEAQLGVVRGSIYRYLGVSEKIVDGVYAEDDWNAFFESVLEPLSIQMSMEVSWKILTKAQRARGETIMYEANRLQYASARTKIDLVDKLSRIGMLSVNEGREIFNLPPVKGGDRFVQSLNYEEVGTEEEVKADERETV